MRHEMTRRDVIRASALLVGGVCGCRMAGEQAAPRPTCYDTPELEPQSLSVAENSLTIDLSKAPSLDHVGNAAYVCCESKSVQLIIVRAGKQRYFALSRFCTHGGQVISYNRRRGVLQCNNFNHSIFDLNGQVVKGPAETPLQSYPVKLVDNTLVIAI